MLIKSVIILCLCIIGMTKPKEITGDTVMIGELEWRTSNLSEVKFANGDPLECVGSTEEWLIAVQENKPAYCYFDFDSSNSETYGVFYNYHAITDPRGLAPDGWRVPTRADLEKLTETTGKLCSRSLRSKRGWDDEGTRFAGSDNFGFNACASGIISTEGKFLNQGRIAQFWIKDKPFDRKGYCFQVESFQDECQLLTATTGTGLSIRLVRDLK